MIMFEEHEITGKCMLEIRKKGTGHDKRNFCLIMGLVEVLP